MTVKKRKVDAVHMRNGQIINALVKVKDKPVGSWVKLKLFFGLCVSNKKLFTRTFLWWAKKLKPD